MSNENKLRPAYLFYPGMMPLLMLNYWVRNPKTPVHGILLSDYDIKHKGKYLNFFEFLIGMIQESGFAYTLEILIVAKYADLLVAICNILNRCTGKKPSIRSFEQIAREEGIPLFRSKDFNGEETHAFLKKINANVIVSAYNNQILKAGTFNLPEHHAVNIHPAYLPNFRGLDGPFEAMFHEVPEAGVTIHWVDARIDTGRIICQEHVAIRPEDSLFTLSVRCWMKGAELLEGVFEMMIAGDVKSWSQNPEDIKFPYRSFPDSKRVREVLRRGRRLLRWREVMEVLRSS